jgi:hypothetical protein
MFCCSNGITVVEKVPSPPEKILPLFDASTEEGRHFLKNVRVYNNVLSLASIGCAERCLPRFNPTFTIQGKMYHRIGLLLPDPGESPKFMQLYFHDMENKLSHCKSIMGELREEVLLDLQEVRKKDFQISTGPSLVT